MLLRCYCTRTEVGMGGVCTTVLCLQEEVHGVWRELGKAISPEVYRHPERHSLLPLKSRCTVVAGGRFREVYYWDRYRSFPLYCFSILRSRSIAVLAFSPFFGSPRLICCVPRLLPVCCSAHCRRRVCLCPNALTRAYAYALVSYWIVKGLLVSGMLRTALRLVDDLLDLVHRFGFVPNGGRK